MIRPTCVALCILAAFAGHAVAGQSSMKLGYLACRFVTDLKRAEELRDSGDNAALQEFIRAALVTTACQWLPAGTPIYVEDRGAGTDIARVRRPGHYQSLFTRRQAVN